SNANEAYEMTKLAFKINGPVYIRITRELEQNFELESGGSLINTMIKSGEKVAIVGSGPFLYKGYELSKLLNERSGINAAVFNLSYIKPYPVDYIKNILEGFEIIITLEDHQIKGGIGSIISEIASEFNPRRILMLGINDRFGECGTKALLDKELGIDIETSFEKVQTFLSKVKTL
ncbi:MAG TPA: transketolase C-terminal domain-containing protein, partial [Candidatus Dojkabacteria bacterium]|nr:transketolase C-terminal domain-containing protein [Candidatus Dojkabacteria bacterium]